MNYTLPLSPFPSQNTPTIDLPDGLCSDEFVDETAVVRLAASRPGLAHIPLRPRIARNPREVTVLAEGESDYAGWNRPVLSELPVHPAFLVPTGVLVEAQPERKEVKRSSEPVAARAAASPFIAVRAQPPVTDPGLGEPVASGFRWWLGAAGGAVCTLLVASLLYSLSAPAPRAVAVENATQEPVFLTPVKFERPVPFRFEQPGAKPQFTIPPDLPRPFSGTPGTSAGTRKRLGGAITPAGAGRIQAPATAAAENF